jgi:hypothetical protein
MLKSESLIQLVNSLSKQEKKEFSCYITNKEEKDYILLFRLIDNKHLIRTEELKQAFFEERPDSSFNTSVTYLYNLLIKILTNLRTEQDSYYLLFNALLHARVLYEKAMYEECFQLLKQIKQKASHYENHFALLIAQRLELNYLLTLDFGDVDEKRLLNKQHKIRNTIKSINKLNEQSSLYELLKLRTLCQDISRSREDVRKLDDLVTSEISIVASETIENFEIKKNHQLFQANYFIAVGDYKAAFNSFVELNHLFEENTHLWNNPPVYYLMTIEGMLESLRIIHDYEGMEYFLDKLTNLKSTSAWFLQDVACVIFICRLSSAIDQGEFGVASSLIEEYQMTVLENFGLLQESRQAKVALYTAFFYLGNNEPRKARRLLGAVIRKGHLYAHNLFRTIRIMNLLVCYELGDIDLIQSEMRSIKREMAKNKERSLKVERLLLKFLNLSFTITDQKKLTEFWKRLEKEVEILYTDKYEQQILRKIDFMAWIESKVFKKDLSEIIKQKYNKQS